MNKGGSPEPLLRRAPAKINIFLRVLRRRPDGYHELESLIQKLDLCDLLSFEQTRDGGITLLCPESDLPVDSGNLAYRAAALVLARYKALHPLDRVGVRITLEKHIPVAAGLGGGSSDAAATLLGMNQLLGNPCSSRELTALGLSLGADVPLFLLDAPSLRATGIGERLQPVPGLEGYLVVLVNPGFAVSTQWVYQSLELTIKSNQFIFPGFDNSFLMPREQEQVIAKYLASGSLVNDLEQVTVSKYPEIERIKEELTAGGAVATLMSGSGPTVFALFPEEKKEAANACYAKVRIMWEKSYLLQPWRASLADGNWF